MTPAKSTLSTELVETTARMLKCLGHPLRLRILDVLELGGELTVSEVQEALGLEQATCSQHLNLMRDKGILARRKDGVNVYYRLGDTRAVKVLGCVRGSVQARAQGLS
jgi:DNA-binding transcriptional ArsR family regulator